MQPPCRQAKFATLNVFLLSIAIAATGCGPAAPEAIDDLGTLGGKFDNPLAVRDVRIEPGGSKRFRVQAESFRVRLVQDGQVPARIAAKNYDHQFDGEASTSPVLEVRMPDEQLRRWTLTVDNLGDAEVLKGKLYVEELVTAGPGMRVRFTQPRCAAIPDRSVPEGVHCYGTTQEKEDSRREAGILDNLIEWIDAARQAKEEHPERDVSIVMAYLTWNDGRPYDALCRATAAGVRFEGFFDSQSGGRQPPSFVQDEDCRPENIRIHYLGGVTDYPDWRLMHIKMMLFETGEATTRLVFGSANLSSYGTSIHFENWVFAEFPSSSHFIESHRCAVAALRAAEGNSYPEDGPLFRDAYDRCVDGIPAEPDPRYQVFFSPDTRRQGLWSLIERMRDAEDGVDMAIQHFSSPSLVNQLARNGSDSTVDARLVLDDDTYYDEGESGGSDFYWYDSTLRGSGVDIRFLQTNGHLEYGKQYQHNKYVVIDGETVFCGAGNFTDVAFGTNYENFYLFDSPELAGQYAGHFERLFSLAQPSSNLPADPAY